MLSVDKRYRFIYKPGVFIASSVPFALMLGGAFGLFGLSLGVDPVERLLHSCGKTALNLLLITLLVTPVRQLTGWTHLIRVRRMLGLFAFFYTVLHFTVYLVLDRTLDWGEIVVDIGKRPYITLGFTALVILIPLAITSTNKMMRRLGRRWQKLHQLVYFVAILGVWHYWWQVKKDIREPLIYVGILAVLLGYRAFVRWRARQRVTLKSESSTVPERT